MCGWETLLLGALMGGASMLGGGKKAPAPPPVQNPATPAPTARAGGAVVRAGTDAKKEETEAAPEYMDFAEKRVSGKALGGLGKSGLGL